MDWKGVMPALTTAFDEKLRVDHEFMGRHARWMVESGCSGLILLGSLGEAAMLSGEERRAVLQNVRAAVRQSIPVVAAISALSTAEVVTQAKAAADAGCSGLMVLPPYVYKRRRAGDEAARGVGFLGHRVAHEETRWLRLRFTDTSRSLCGFSAFGQQYQFDRAGAQRF